jgi:hypothetical protein
MRTLAKATDGCRRRRVGHNCGVSSRLSRVSTSGRRRLAATLLLFAALFAAIGVVSAFGRASAGAPAFCAIALSLAALLGLIGWGMQRSVAIDLADERLDAAIEDTIAASGGHAAMCGCGVEHDPNELHLVGDQHGQSTDACSHDGTGAACAHDCQTCVLTALRTR